MIRSKLCNYNDAYILVKRIIAAQNTGKTATLNNRNKTVIFKNSAPFTDYISKISNKEKDHVKKHWCSNANA